MAEIKEIWVLPEISENDEEISPLSLGLLSEARSVAEKTGGAVTALLPGNGNRQDYAGRLGQYGISRAYVFQDPALQYFSADAYSSALLPVIKQEQPWLLLMGHTTSGIELAPRLAALLDTGVITNCAKIDLSRPERPGFYRLVYGDQLYQEVAFRTSRTMLVTMDPRVLNVSIDAKQCEVKVTVIGPKIPPRAIRIRHLEFLPADYKTVDVTDANVIVSVGAGGGTDELLPMIEELSHLIKGAIGTTRPVVDSGKIPRERLVGQTGKLVSPELYIALGISGSPHHVGGIQGAAKIIAINRDPQAPIFQNSDTGIVADIKDVLPRLIARIKQAQQDGTAV